MTQDERWLLKYNEVLAFMEREHRDPSKRSPEEILMNMAMRRIDLWGKTFL